QATEQAGCRGVHAGAGGEAVRPQPAGGGELLGVLRQVALAGPRGTGDEQVSPRTGESLVDKVPHRGDFSTPPYWFHLVIVVCRPFPPGPAAPSGILRVSCRQAGRLRAGTRAAGRRHGGGPVVTGGQRGTKSHAASVSSWRRSRTPGATAGLRGTTEPGGPVARRGTAGTGGAGARAAGRRHGGGPVVTGGQRGTKSHAASVSSWRRSRTPGATAGLRGTTEPGGPVDRRVNPGTGGPVDRCGWPGQPPWHRTGGAP